MRILISTRGGGWNQGGDELFNLELLQNMKRKVVKKQVMKVVKKQKRATGNSEREQESFCPLSRS